MRTMSTHPTCERCKREILPGSNVDFIMLEEDPRIVLSEDLIIVHTRCPNS